MSEYAELIPYLASPQASVYGAALEALLPYTQKTRGKVYIFTENDYAGARSIARIFSSGQFQKESCIALVNLSDNPEIRKMLAEDKSIVDNVIETICNKSQNSKLACMLLLNLAHSSSLSESLEFQQLSRLVRLLETEKHESYDFLALFFAEVARTQLGCEFLSGKAAGSKSLPIASLCPELVLSSAARRTGIAATIKNMLFEISTHSKIIEAGAVEYIMIALKGPEKMDERDASELPQIVRKEFSDNKCREVSTEQQLLLMEALLLLSSSQQGREGLRRLNTYYIVRELHSASTDREVMDVCEKFVNMVMRGEPGSAPANEPMIQEVDNDDEIIEVV